jgi:heptosyltransferase-1
VEPACSGIVTLHSGVDRVIIFNRKEWITGIFSLYRELRQQRFEVTLDLQRHSKSGLFSLLSGSPRRLGFHRKDSKEGNWLCNTEYVPEQGDTLPKIEHYHLFLDALGVPKGEITVKPLSAITLETLPDEIKSQIGQPYVALVLGSSWQSKDWPEEGYRNLIRILLRETAYSIVLLGDKGRVEMGARLFADTNNARVVNCAGRTDLRGLIGLLGSATVVVGPDSGPGHICGAVGTPHVTLFGPTPVGRNAPRGSEQLTMVSSVGCSPCKMRVCPGLGGICMRLLTAEAVFGKIQQVIRP